MTEEEKKNIAVAIDKRIEKTKGEIEDLKELTRPIAPENAIGRVSRMDAINNKSVNEAALRQAREKLSKLEYARGRIDDPDFGKCARCGEDIQAGRLVLMPESNKCIRCA